MNDQDWDLIYDNGQNLTFSEYSKYAKIGYNFGFMSNNKAIFNHFVREPLNLNLILAFLNKVCFITKLLKHVDFDPAKSVHAPMIKYDLFVEYASEIQSGKFYIAGRGCDVKTCQYIALHGGDFKCIDGLDTQRIINKLL